MKHYMKILLITLLLINTSLSQNIWHVNRDATGNNNGTSWNNAWRNLNNINWNSISAGDTIYVSGGNDSTVYTPSSVYGIILGNISNSSPSWTFANGNPVVICPAWQAGHNGDVYFATSNDNQQSLMRVGNIANLKINGFTFIDRRNNPGETSAFIQLGNADWGDIDSLYFFTNNHVIGNGSSGLLFLNTTKATIDNCVIEHLENSKPNDQDPLGVSGGRGGHTISNCAIIMRNDNSLTDAHRDGLQWSNFGATSTSRVTNRIFNNLIIDTKAAGTSWTALIYSDGSEADVDWYIYNNIIISRKNATPVGGIVLSTPFGSNRASAWILNNTIIMNNNGSGLSTPIVTGGNGKWDTLVVKNNLVIMDAPTNLFYNLAWRFPPDWYWRDIDYNGHFEYGGISNPFGSGEGFGSFSLVQWQDSLHDVNSLFGNSTAVTFINKYGINKTDYYTTTGRDAGENLSAEYPFLSYDILGNPRTGAWDIGALEFQDGSQSNYINFSGKLFLQGPYNNNSMQTNLVHNGLLPTSQPYNTAPWNYNGSETLSSSSDCVDWVLVELRNSSNPTQIVSRRAAVLKNDGSLNNFDGSTGIRFNNVPAGQYYVAVFHRNHLPVMSANPIQLSSNSTLYDFTTAMNKAYGLNPMINLGDGRFAMIAADGNGNGGINITDRNDVWLPVNGTLGYLSGDFNLDGGVTIHDVNLFWNLNNGKMTQVP